MADNNFRSSRSRDPRAGGSAAPVPPRDPLAELARLIGQSDTTGGDYAREHQQAETYAENPADAMEWSADHGYAAPAQQPEYQQPEYQQPEYQQPEYQQQPDYHQARRAEQQPESYQDYSSQDYSSYPTQPRQDSAQEPEVEYVPPPAARLSPPPVDYGDTQHGAGYGRDVPRDGYADDYGRGDDHRGYDQAEYDEQPGAYGDAAHQAVTPLAPQAHDQADDHEPVERWEDSVDDPSYATDEYEEAYEDDEPLPPPVPRRSRLMTVLAVLALAATGSAGAFAYRTMFGGTMLPGMPPIIRPSDGPNKIVPSRADTQASAAQAASGSGEKLVSREEQPLDIPTAPKTSPRVVSTIPVLPTPGPSPSESAAMTPAITPPSSAAPFPPAPLSGAGTLAAPMTAAPAPGAAAPAAPAPAPGSAEPKKVHTVTIHQEPPAARPKPATPPAPRTTAPQGGGSAPLSLVPGAEGDTPAPAAPRTQVARTSPPSAPMTTTPAATTPAATTPPATGGGYAVQLSSQRSEAEAQSAYREMQGRFPSQLANRTPIIRRADLGAKGTYYRTLVGPFASHEEAETMCSNLKAAGGSCIVQKN